MYVVSAELTRTKLPLPPVGQVANAEPPPEVDRDCLLSSYYELRERVVQEAEAGHLETAFHLCDEAMEIAELVGDQELVDQAYCNCSNFAIVLGQPLDFSRLREIVTRTRSESVSFWASYQLASGFAREKHYKKALFYARIAHGRAVATKSTDHLVHSHNQIGNCLLAESYFEEAIAEYEAALALIGDLPSGFHMILFVNLAYSKIVLREFTDGFRLLFRALKLCRRMRGGHVYESWTHLALAYAFLEIGRVRYAWRHGSLGLRLAERSGDREALRTALYLMGEIEKVGGDWASAYEYYHQMQQEFFPEMSDLAKTMMVVDTRELVNLRA
jgi:tetratricopeptide (TPR) repeat protein